MAGTHHGLNLLLIAAFLQSLLELVLGGDVGGIVLVNLFRAVSSRSSLVPGVPTRLYEFSRKVAMMGVCCKI
jgi:hypothetical protein